MSFQTPSVFRGRLLLEVINCSIYPMNTLKLWRTFDEGMVNVRRNGWLSFATISILALSLFIIGLSAFMLYSTRVVLESAEDKVNLIVSFKRDVREDRILEIRSSLGQYTQEIDSVEYVSRERALEEFLAVDGANETVRKALEEIGENPLYASLIIKATDLKYYEVIATNIQNSSFQDEISRINYAEVKHIFERLQSINRDVTVAGLTLGSIFVLVAFIITFYTMFITILSHQQEFEIMRLVGASNLYMKMPFIFEGLLYGAVSSVIASIFLLFVSHVFASSGVGVSLGEGVSLLFPSSLLLIFVGLFVLGVVLTSLSTSFAIRRYLKI